MALKNVLFLFVSLFFHHLQPSISQSTVKSAYWLSDGGLLAASDIDSTLFTHLFCAFANLDNQSYQVTISSADQASFTKTVQQKNPSIKTLLSIGGGNSQRTAFAAMASQPASRKSFIDSSISVARANGFHGVDLDWEYPQSQQEMDNMGILFDEWRAALQSESQSSPLLLTAALHFSSNYITDSGDSLNYPVESIQRNLDWINAMAYDFKAPGWSSQSTGAPAALYEPSSRYSGSAGIDVWIGSGLSAKKIALGLPFYGYAWKLVDPNQHGIGAPASGRATAAGVDEEDGSITYKNIVAFIGSGAVSEYDSSRVTDYCYSGSTWIGFDGPKSIAAKVSYAKEKELLGYFAWRVDQDNDGDLSRTASQAWS